MSKLLTDREFKYATRRFKGITTVFSWLWLVYLFFIGIGIAMIYDADGSFVVFMGIFFMLAGVIGFVYFKVLKRGTIFMVDKVAHIQTGVLTSKLVRIGRGTDIVFSIDDTQMITPVGLEDYLLELEEQYQGKNVTVSLAACSVTQPHKSKDDNQKLYTPIQIENDICIDEAIQKHGEKFLHHTTRKYWLNILLYILLFGVVGFGGIMIADQFDSDAAIYIFVLLFMVFMFYLGKKDYSIVDTIDLKEKLKGN